MKTIVLRGDGTQNLQVGDFVQAKVTDTLSFTVSGEVIGSE
jgi:hypothetical protein